MATSDSVLIVELRYEGHHLMYMVGVVRAFLKAGRQVTLALDLRNDQALASIRRRDPLLLNKVTVLSLFDEHQQWRGGSLLESVSLCTADVCADEVFFNCFDEIASSLFRRAALGILPPKNIRGKLSGIYLRARPVDPKEKGFGKCWKAYGLKRLLKKNTFKHLFLMDEFLPNPDPNVFSFLPDPYFNDFKYTREEARQALGIPLDRIVFLHYGTAGKRKGLSVFLEAFSGLHNERKWLLCAGRQSDSAILKALQAEVHQDCASYLDHYIFEEEETLCFCAADCVCIPYIDHYGSSGPFVRAAGTGKPVIVSDCRLLRRRTEEYDMGLVCKQNDAQSLLNTLECFCQLGSDELERLQANAKRCGALFNESSFEAHLLKQRP